ncbi:type II toxin-antitoxin system prevent-host-death family antitoxin [Methylobacterium sp. NEAU 140]|uniref:type II toxin-antitoxin system Phd/YefM family antitoxin n=1 Tax=Methylobacterium sp. NEAU 140 TaxID=3064945 RepID=UPI002735D8B5|nr:type II toxin-antitoxin system prevent-host-death family antitoxin [Methylobacterium sp. NEAU 140]MDP4024568.1 type II toxin-antitoxin system prevent-host-death family antitoxin [Methylobacterium sp. NEAU 140]
MKTVSLDDARADLPNLVARAARGEPFLITEAGQPLVKVEAADRSPPARRRLGSLAGQFSVPDDFDRMGEDEIIRLFEGT